MENLEKRILVLSKWLKECTIYNDSDGVIERAINQSKEDTLQQVGELLSEVLEMSDKEIEFELKIKFDQNE
jgi:hypothetical protein